MLRVICGHCGKKLEMPDAWARNVVKCPQCRAPIDLQKAAAAEGAVKLGQFLKENLAGGSGGKPGPSGRRSAPRGLLGAISTVLQRHGFVIAIVAVAALLIVLDTTWLHTMLIAIASVVGAVIAAGAWHSEATRHVPSAARRAEVEYKVALGLVALLGLGMVWFCFAEISAISATRELAGVAPAFELLPKWAAVLVVLLTAAVVMGASVGALALVQRSSIYHVLSAGLVLLSLVYGVAEIAAQQTVGVGVGEFVHQQFEPPPAGTVASNGNSGVNVPAATVSSAPAGKAGVVTVDGGPAASGAAVEKSVHRPTPPAEPAVVRWTAIADPPESSPPKIGRQMPDIHREPQPWDPLTPPVPSSWLAIGDNRREQSVRELWDLAGPERLGKLEGQIDFVEPVALSADAPMIAGYNSTSMLIEVWSFSEGQMVGRLDCHDIAKSTRPFIAFIAPETLLVVHARANDLAAPPVCQIWNFVGDEMVAEFAATGCNGDPKNQWALSPGRGYFAVADKSLLHVYDIIEKRLVGKSSVPVVPASVPLDCAGLAFTSDGQQVTAIFRGPKNSRLLSWNLGDGNVAADREFNFDLARGSPPDCQPIKPLAPGSGWLVFERVIIPSFSGKLVLSSTIVEPPAAGGGTPRFAKALDADRILVIADDSLQVVKLPRKRGESKELLTLAQLFSASAAGSPKGKTGPNQRSMPAAGQTAEGVADAVSRAYTRAAYIDFLTADDDWISEQARWAPWSKRPVFGLRLGLGVLPTNVPEKTVQQQRIDPVTGPVGPKLVSGLDERLATGVFGAWAPGEDSRLSRVGWLGVGKSGKLTAAAKRQDLDIMLVMYVNWGKADQRQISVRIADVVNALPIWSSSTLKVTIPSGTPPKGEAGDKWVADVLRQVDQKMALQPIPELTAEDAKQAAEKLISSKHRDLAADLVELRIYQVKHLIDDTDAADYYEQLLGAGMGETFAHGDAEARREILEKVLPAN